MIRTVPVSIIRSFSLYKAMVYVRKPVWHIPLLCVGWKTPDDGQTNWPKHVEFYSKNKFEKLVHLVGFIIRICHDARSAERQTPGFNLILSSSSVGSGATANATWFVEQIMTIYGQKLCHCSGSTRQKRYQISSLGQNSCTLRKTWKNRMQKYLRW
jgi:hypothetical protein